MNEGGGGLNCFTPTPRMKEFTWLRQMVILKTYLQMYKVHMRPIIILCRVEHNWHQEF